MEIIDLGTLDYRSAWQKQEAAHARVLEGGPPVIFLVEHPPVITFGRRGPTPTLLASREQLEKIGVELIESDRGGDVTFHGPGQLVAYPIVKLADHRLSVSGYVHSLEKAILRTLAHFGIESHTDPAAVGVWVGGSADTLAPPAAKIAAIGVRIRRGVSLHGLALNHTTNLDYFNLIIPCGLQGRPVTSIRKILAERTPAMAQLKDRLVAELREVLIPSPSASGRGPG